MSTVHLLLWAGAEHCDSRSIWQKTDIRVTDGQESEVQGCTLPVAMSETRQSAIELTEHSPENSKATLGACCRGKAQEDCSQTSSSCWASSCLPLPCSFCLWHEGTSLYLVQCDCFLGKSTPHWEAYIQIIMKMAFLGAMILSWINDLTGLFELA